MIKLNKNTVYERERSRMMWLFKKRSVVVANKDDKIHYNNRMEKEMPEVCIVISDRILMDGDYCYRLNECKCMRKKN